MRFVSLSALGTKLRDQLSIPRAELSVPSLSEVASFEAASGSAVQAAGLTSVSYWTHLITSGETFESGRTSYRGQVVEVHAVIC